MRLKYLILPSFITLMTFSSCQREIDLSINRQTDINDSIYLKMYVQLDTTLATGSDTLYRAAFSYDAQKRVILKSEYFDFFGTPDITTTNYFYSGSDAEPYKMVVTYSDFVNIYRDTSFLFYNTGIVIKDSTISYNITNNSFWGTSVAVFTPFTSASGNNMFIQHRGYNNPPPSAPDDQWSGMLMQTRVNGNITSQDDTTTFGSIYTDRKHHEVSYDNKVNPFYRVELRYPILNGYKYLQKNNPIESRSWDIPGQFEDHVRYTYIYRADGYPQSVTFPDVTNPNNYKGIYKYTN